MRRDVNGDLEAFRYGRMSRYRSRKTRLASASRVAQILPLLQTDPRRLMQFRMRCISDSLNYTSRRATGIKTIEIGLAMPNATNCFCISPDLQYMHIHIHILFCLSLSLALFISQYYIYSIIYNSSIVYIWKRKRDSTSYSSFIVFLSSSFYCRDVLGLPRDILLTSNLSQFYLSSGIIRDWCSARPLSRL